MVLSARVLACRNAGLHLLRHPIIAELSYPSRAALGSTPVQSAREKANRCEPRQRLQCRLTRREAQRGMSPAATVRCAAVTLICLQSLCSGGRAHVARSQKPWAPPPPLQSCPIHSRPGTLARQSRRSTVAGVDSATLPKWKKANAKRIHPAKPLPPEGPPLDVTIVPHKQVRASEPAVCSSRFCEPLLHTWSSITANCDCRSECN